jgi:hypothetical protein
MVDVNRLPVAYSSHLEPTHPSFSDDVCSDHHLAKREDRRKEGGKGDESQLLLR